MISSVTRLQQQEWKVWGISSLLWEIEVEEKRRGWERLWEYRARWLVSKKKKVEEPQRRTDMFFFSLSISCRLLLWHVTEDTNSWVREKLQAAFIWPLIGAFSHTYVHTLTHTAKVMCAHTQTLTNTTKSHARAHTDTHKHICIQSVQKVKKRITFQLQQMLISFTSNPASFRHLPLSCSYSICLAMTTNPSTGVNLALSSWYRQLLSNWSL